MKKHEYFSYFLAASTKFEQNTSAFRVFRDSIFPGDGAAGGRSKFTKEEYIFLAIFVLVFSNQYLTQEAITLLIRFLNLFLLSLGIDFQLPKSFVTLESWLGADNMTQAMNEYVSCTKCHALYIRSLGSAIPARCNNKPDFSPVCNEPLFKTKEGSNLRGAPFKIYPANSIIKSIQQMMQRPDFEEKIERWRSRSAESNQKGDISDGTMWHEIKNNQGNKFCDKKRSLFFTLNVDWLNVFSGKNYGHHSIGAMFLSCDLLPREEHLKPGNIINLGVIPGPKEPNFEQKYNYLNLAIDEFSSLYNGVKFTTFESPDCPVVVRAALLKIGRISIIF